MSPFVFEGIKLQSIEWKRILLLAIFRNFQTLIENLETKIKSSLELIIPQYIFCENNQLISNPNPIPICDSQIQPHLNFIVSTGSA